MNILIRFNRPIFQIILLAVIYSLFMAISLAPYSLIYMFLNQGDPISKVLLFVIPAFYIYAAYSITIFVFSPFFYLLFTVLFTGFEKINGYNLQKFIANITIRLKKRNILEKYFVLYIASSLSFMLFLFNGIYLPIWLYEQVFKTRAFFRIDEAVHFFFNFQTALIHGFFGFLVFALINELAKKLFSKQINLAKLFKII